MSQLKRKIKSSVKSAIEVIKGQLYIRTLIIATGSHPHGLMAFYYEYFVKFREKVRSTQEDDELESL